MPPAQARQLSSIASWPERDSGTALARGGLELVTGGSPADESSKGGPQGLFAVPELRAFHPYSSVDTVTMPVTIPVTIPHTIPHLKSPDPVHRPGPRLSERHLESSASSSARRPHPEHTLHNPARCTHYHTSHTSPLCVTDGLRFLGLCRRSPSATITASNKMSVFATIYQRLSESSELPWRALLLGVFVVGGLMIGVGKETDGGRERLAYALLVWSGAHPDGADVAHDARLLHGRGQRTMAERRPLAAPPLLPRPRGLLLDYPLAAPHASLWPVPSKAARGALL